MLQHKALRERTSLVILHPFPNSDFSSYLLKAQASGADVVALANAGQDTINTVKQASEFGINKKQTIVPLLMFITDVHSLGLNAAQGMYLTEGFYWCPKLFRRLQ